MAVPGLGASTWRRQAFPLHRSQSPRQRSNLTLQPRTLPPLHHPRKTTSPHQRSTTVSFITTSTECTSTIVIPDSDRPSRSVVRHPLATPFSPASTVVANRCPQEKASSLPFLRYPPLTTHTMALKRINKELADLGRYVTLFLTAQPSDRARRRLAEAGLRE